MKSNDKRLILIISFLLIIGFLLTSLASFYASRESLRSEIADNSLPLTSDNVYSEIQRDLLRPVFISSLMAADTFLRDWILLGEGQQRHVVKYLKEINEKYNTVTAFYVSDATKKYYHPSGLLKTISQDEPRDAWYYRVRNMKEDYEINVDPDMANSDEMTIFVNYKVFDYVGNYIGATGVGLTVSSVKRLISSYQEKYNRNIYFVGRDGNVTLHGRNFNEEGYKSHLNEDLQQHLNITSTNPEKSFRYKKGRATYHANVRYISEFKWFLVVEQSEGKAFRDMYKTLLVNIGICILVTCLIIFLVKVSITVYQKRIETLKGIVPICSFCKQIRDDKGYWNQVEEYVSKHTDAEFSHGVCPHCMEKHYPGFTKKT